MKNREKFRNELMEAIKEGRLCAFMQKHGVYRMFKPDWESFCVLMNCHFCPTVLQLWLDEEYKMPEVDWENVPVDTLVRVRDHESKDWNLRYFKGIDNRNSYRFMVWSAGATSVTAEGSYMNWKYCELVEDKDDEESR